jgi:superfamily I DNA/RNA helicase
VADAVQFIDALFADGATGVLTLATYHRSKGREWDRVFLFEHYRRCPSKYARQDWQKLQEDNLAYVAFTRAKQELWFYNPMEQ